MPDRYQRRQLAGSIDGSLLRYQTYNGVEHLVAPVIALVGDVVVRPSNSLGPEYVPSNVLSLIPESWNGRPVVYNHPSNDTGSANDPTILDTMCFGSMFNTTFEDKKLKAEVWLDKSRAETIGASEAVTRCANGETVEVSVGAFVLLKKESGIADGKPYEYIWQGVIPDHLALLENGSTGACSVEMGCGTPRLMQRLMEGGVDVTEQTKPNDQSQSSGFLRSLQRMFSWALRTNELSDSDLRWKLASLLYDVEPGFVEVVDVYHETNRVIYLCYTEREYHYYQRTFTATNDVPALNDDRAEGQWNTEFKVFTASEETTNTTTTTIVQATHACGCQSKESNNKEADEVKNPIVDRLISKKLVAEDQRAKIEALPDALIVALAATLEGGGEKEEKSEKSDKGGDKTEVKAETTPPVTTPTTPTTPTAEEPKPLTAEQFMAQAPESIRQLVKRAEIEEANRRTHYISQLSKAQTHLKADQLQTRTTDQLEEMIALLGLNTTEPLTMDFSGQGIGISPSPTSNYSTYTAPDPWGIVKSNKEAN